LAELARLPSVKLVRGGRADVWLAPATSTSPAGRPLVVQLHEASWLDPALRRHLDPSFAAHLEKFTAASLAVAARAITPSEASRRQVIQWTGFAAERVHAVPHGVDHSRFRPQLAVRSPAADGPYVLFVGVLHPRKNLDGLRVAMAGLAARGFPHRLIVVGGAPADRAEPDDLEARLAVPGWPGRLRLMRDLNDAALASLIAGADAFCLPSFYEGFGLPVLEAMACGVPVVVSDRGALPEVVGEAGLVVTPEPLAIEAALARVLESRELADQLRSAAVRRAGAFTWRRSAEGWLAALEQAASDV